MTQQAKIVRLPCDPAARRERQLAALWAKRDKLELDLRLLDREIAPVQREVSLDQGYSFAVGREKLERALRRKTRQSDASMKLAVRMIDQMKGERK